MSPEMRLIILPRGVLSKKRIGAFMILLIILLCNRFAAVSPMNSRKAIAKMINLCLNELCKILQPRQLYIMCRYCSCHQLNADDFFYQSNTMHLFTVTLSSQIGGYSVLILNITNR